MKNLAIIPARGGSKRIPRKNIKEFLGKPIIAYSIEAALNSKLFDEVMVSTEDEEIAFIAQNYGAKVPFLRSKENADDYATIKEVAIEVLNQYKNSNCIFENICIILPAAPLIYPDLLIESYKILSSTNFNIINPIVKYSYPIQRAFVLENNEIRLMNSMYLKARSQDLQPTYHDAGMFYWRKIVSLYQKEKRYGFVVNEMDCQDIDSEEDWLVAEFKYQYRKKYMHE